MDELREFMKLHMCRFTVRVSVDASREFLHRDTTIAEIVS